MGKNPSLCFWGLCLIGCASQPVVNFQSQIQQGDLLGAQNSLDSLYDNQKSRVLHNLYEASLRQLNGDLVGSNSIFEETKLLADELALLSISETVGASTVGESLRSYGGSEFERLMIYCHKFINYMALGLFNEARIEMEQAELKLREWKTDLSVFPFLSVFSALAYEALGDADNALVAYRRALQAYEDDGGAAQIVRQSYLNVLARNNRLAELRDQERKFNMKAQDVKDKKASLVVVLTAGMVTSRYAHGIDFWDEDSSQRVFILLPTYPPSWTAVPPPIVSLNQGEQRSQLVINAETEMRSALVKAMPGYVARAISRSIVREQLRQRAEKENVLLGALFSIANVVTEAATADTRSWDILPQGFFLARIEQPAGMLRMKTDLVGTAFGPLEQDLELEPGFNFVLFLGR